MIDRLTLRAAGGFLIAGFGVHNLDHARRGLSVVDEGIVWAGTFLMVGTAVVLTLVFTGHDRAPLAATMIGPAIAVGVSASHLPPEWGPLSDPLLVAGASPVSLIAAGIEVAAGAVFGLVGWRILRENRYDFKVPASAW